MKNNYFFFLCLSTLFFSCTSDEPETVGPDPNLLLENILGQWDFEYEETVYSAKSKTGYLKGNENDDSFRIFTLVFRKNFEYHVVHSQGSHSGSYEILDASTISLSGLGTLEDVLVSEGTISATLVIEDGTKTPFKGNFQNGYKDGDCISFLDCYHDEYWVRRFSAFPEEDPSRVYYNYVTFKNDVSGVWWKNIVLDQDNGCIISINDNQWENAEFSILAHTANLFIFRKESANEILLYKYVMKKEHSRYYLYLEIVDLKTSLTANYNYISGKLNPIPVFEDYSGCNNEEKVYVPDDVFEQRLITLGLDDVPDDYVLKSQVEGVTQLDLSVPLSSDVDQIQDLTGIEAFVNLKKLNVENNALTEFNVSALKDVEELKLNGNQLTILDFSSNSQLYNLEANENKITEIDISNSPDLGSLELINNLLQNIDLSNNPKINDLMLRGNNLSSIDLSHNINLWDLTLNDNYLTSLDLSNQKELWFLGASNNQLSAIDLTEAAALQFLSLDNNQLTHIDLTGLIALQEINIENNQLEDLELWEKPGMYLVYAENNKLSSLDLSALDHEYLAVRVRNNSLTCIQVNAIHLADPPGWKMDEGVVLSLDCN